MEDALIALVRHKTLFIGKTIKGSVATIQADALIKRGLATKGDSKVVKATISPSKGTLHFAPTLLPTEQGVEKAKALLLNRGGV